MNAHAPQPGCATLRPDLAACFAVNRVRTARRDRVQLPAFGVLAELAKYGRP
jgi:hypothetical protein